MQNWPSFSPSRLLRRLVAHGVDFVVIGGIALIAHGSVRNTRDLDIVYATDQANLEALGAALIKIRARLRGVPDDAPFVPDARTLRPMSILTLDSDEGWIDLLVAPAGAPPYAQLRARAERVMIGSVAVLIASLEDLEEMKRAAGRTRDLADLEEIEVIRRLQARV